MNSFVYSLPVKVYFGKGMLCTALEQELKNVGANIMLAYGGGSIKRNGIYDEVIEKLKSMNKNVFEFSDIMSNPTYQKVQEGAKMAKEKHIDFILAVGGGSVIDCCKIISAQAKLDQDIWELEFKYNQLPSQFIPMGAIVTASGTSAEMNNGAVITHEELKVKTGIWGAYASFAVLDPSYTLTVPFSQVISGAFDTLSHAMETYFGKNECVSDEISETIMRNTIFNIRKLMSEPMDLKARSELMWDSAMAENGLLKLGKVTDFQAHQIEHQLGALTNCNHGQGLAVIHPVLYRYIYKGNLAQFKRYAVEVWNVDEKGLSDEAVALKGIEKLSEFIKEIGLPTSLSQMGIRDINILKRVADSTNISAGCCQKLTAHDIYMILKECL